MMCKVVRVQKLIYQYIMKSTKTQKLRFYIQYTLTNIIACHPLHAVKS